MKKFLITLLGFVIFYQTIKQYDIQQWLLSNANILLSTPKILITSTDPKHKNIKIQDHRDQESPKTQKQELVEFSGNALERSLSRIFFNVLNTQEGQALLQNMLQNNPYQGRYEENLSLNNKEIFQELLQIKTISLQGQKDSDDNIATCGHSVIVDYKLTTPGGKAITQENALINLGNNAVFPGFDAVIIGMRTQEMRQAQVPIHYFTQQETNNPQIISVNVTLKEIKTQGVSITKNIRIFDDQVAYSIPIICGQMVNFHVKIMRLKNGHILYDSEQRQEPIAMRLGDHHYPIIFSHSLHNKLTKGIRTVIAKAYYMRPFLQHAKPRIKLSEYIANDEYIMLEFSLIKQQLDKQDTTIKDR
jgi:FKBP-type peptidyl-prolyl cis-trans isomerase 2